MALLYFLVLSFRFVFVLVAVLGVWRVEAILFQWLLQFYHWIKDNLLNSFHDVPHGLVFLFQSHFLHCSQPDLKLEARGLV